MAKGDLHIVGIVQEHAAITNHDMLAAFQGERIPSDCVKLIRWKGKLYVYAIEPSRLWEITAKKPAPQETT